MNVDYLLIGYGRKGEIKSVEHEEGDILPKVLTFEPANSDGAQYPKRTFEVLITNHLGNRYAVAVALEAGEVLDWAKISALIESSGMMPVADVIIGEI